MEIRDDGGLRVDAPELDAQFTVSGCAPVQGFGTVLGRDLYFRARHEHWSFEIADAAGRFPSDGAPDAPGMFFREVEYDGASYMPLREAVVLVLRCLAVYTGETVHIGALVFPET